MKIFKFIVIVLLVSAFTALGMGIWFGARLSPDENNIDETKLGRNYNTLKFDDRQVEQIKADHKVLDSLFRLISKTLNIPIYHTGYVAYDTVFYYRNCTDNRGNYLSISDCHLRTLLDESIIRQADIAVRSLIRLGFNSCQYESVFNEFTLLVDTEFLDSRDHRTVLVSDDIDSIFISKTYRKVIEYKRGLALFKQ